jgi:hypothetical protein
MPIGLRNFIHGKIVEYQMGKNKPNDNVQESIKTLKSVGATPDKNPTYTTKTSKK